MKIIIKGERAEGKTTIAKVIHDHLLGLGYKIETVVDENKAGTKWIQHGDLHLHRIISAFATGKRITRVNITVEG